MLTYDLGGIYVPELLLDGLAAALLTLLVAQVAGRFGLYRHIWHPALFNTALFVVVLALLALPPSHWWS